MFTNTIHTILAMAAIWILGVFALWFVPQPVHGHGIGQNVATVYTVDPDATVLYQDRSAEFTVPMRVTRPTVIF